MVDTTKRKEYQKKYDEKTKMLSVKYVLSDMDDYDRLKNYLDRTGKSANGFIKELINDFFEHKKYVMSDERIADYLKDYNVSEELLDKLKSTVGNDKFEIIMDSYKGIIESEIYLNYTDKGDSFGEWVEQFLVDVECGDIDINMPEKEFGKLVDVSICQEVGDVSFCG